MCSEAPVIYMYIYLPVFFQNMEESVHNKCTPIGVFWDIENCCVPKWRSALWVVQKIRTEFFSGHREVEFMCVCDTSKESKVVIQELNSAQVCISMHICMYMFINEMH